MLMCNVQISRFSKHKVVFMSGLVVTGAGYFSLQFVPGLAPDLATSLDCSSPWSILKVRQQPVESEFKS